MNSTEIHRLPLVLFDNHPLSHDCVTGICLDCGMAFNRETLSAESYNTYYSVLSKYVVSTSAKASVPRLPECAEMLAGLLPHDAFILDAGCGSGGVLAALKNQGFINLAGIDPTPECVNIIKDELGLDARVGTLGNSPFAPGMFDVVISTVVFEHLLNPGEDIDKIASLLKPGGSAYILIPDATRYAEFMTAPYQDVNVEHINHFSLGCLNNLFAVRGWDKVASGSGMFTFSETWRSTLIWGLYRKGDISGGIFAKDQILRPNLQDYFVKSSLLLAEIKDNLDKDLMDEKEVIIWGAGHATSVLLAHGAFEGKKIHAVIDNNPSYKGQTLCGIPVGGHELRGDFKGAIVVATVRERDSVIRHIKSLGWLNRLICLRNA
jgi:SAM-dependent methyltransferase